MEFWLIIILSLVAGGAVAYFLARKRAVPEKETQEPTSALPKASQETLHEPEELPQAVAAEFFEPHDTPAPALGHKLAKTRSFFKDRFDRFWRLTVGQNISQDEWDALEETLLEADVGPATTRHLIEKVKGRLKEERDLKALMKEECLSLFPGEWGASYESKISTTPYVISIVGVNGVGKTTSIGKLANHFAKLGKKVLLGAGDTFRAAAISQLKVWADRTGAQFVAGREGGDPGAVAFDSVTAAKARAIDIVLLDTAGRLHTKVSLMDELKKVHRVIKKVIPEAPHETWLVLDGTLGQNSLQQAKEFKKVLELTGVIITKLDGTARGGAILSVSQELGLPVRYIGIGESAEDFIPFNPHQFVDAILGE